MHKPIRVLVIASAVALGIVAVAGIAHAAAGRAVTGPVLGPAPTTSASAKKTTATTAKPKAAAVTTAKATATTKATAVKAATATTKATAAKSATATTKVANSTKAAATTTAKKATATTTAAKSASAATTVANTTAAPTSYRVQAGAARTRAEAVRLQRAALDVDKTAAFVVTPGRVIAGSTYRVVSGCRTAADAAALKAALSAKSVPALVYRSKRC